MKNTYAGCLNMAEVERRKLQIGADMRREARRKTRTRRTLLLVAAAWLGCGAVAGAASNAHWRAKHHSETPGYDCAGSLLLVPLGAMALFMQAFDTDLFSSGLSFDCTGAPAHETSGGFAQAAVPISMVCSQGTCFYTSVSAQTVTFVGGASVSQEERYAFAPLVPFEAAGDKELRKAFRAWVSSLPDGKPKAAYAAVLDEFDQNDAMLERERADREAAAGLIKDAPRATCARDVSGVYKCETEKAKNTGAP